MGKNKNSKNQQKNELNNVFKNKGKIRRKKNNRKTKKGNGNRMHKEPKEKYSKYNKYADNDEWQKKCIEEIKNEDNIILSSPTGSGKTRVYLEWAKQKGNKPVIITTPTKALANQQYRDLVKEGYTVGLETGDIKKVPEQCDFICCTQEIYTNKYIFEKDVTVIMDEFHYIFDDASRARTYIDALNKSKAKNMLLCSATFGDIKKLVKYAERVSGRSFKEYESKSRLTSLYFEGNIKAKEIKDALVVTFSKENVERILDELKVKRKDKEENKEKEIEICELAKERKIRKKVIIEDARMGLAGYYGALLPKEKMFIEECFEKKLIDTVVGTDALALGVNFPVKEVVFAQLTKIGNNKNRTIISKNLFDQLCGRAGRKGFFNVGRVYYCSELAENPRKGEYKVDELYKEILEKTNENMKIILTPNIKDLLLEYTTIEEEVDFISKFSTEKVDKDEKYEDIKDILEYIYDEGFEKAVKELKEDSKSKDIVGLKDKKYIETKKQEFIENIPEVYFDEYSCEQNCKMFTNIICGVNPDDIVEDVRKKGTFYEMLQFRKYVNSLPRRYRKGLTKINDIIRKIDETAIDEERGTVEVDNIIEQLDKDSKLEIENVENVLKDLEEQNDIENNKRQNGFTVKGKAKKESSREEMWIGG